jgi:predicted enzyme related to lactoylglutathione lyase
MQSSIIKWLAAAALLTLLTLPQGCASMRSELTLPPVSAKPTGKTTPGKVIWYELLTEDAETARRFYKGLFGWSFDAWPGAKGYEVVRLDGKPIAGLAEIKGEDEPEESIWLVSISVADVDRAAELTRDQNGEIVDAPVDIQGRGRLAVLRDPSGAAFIALHAAGGDPPDRRPAIGGFHWADYVTTEDQAATRYYADLAGYEVRKIEAGPDHTYKLFVRNRRPRAGVVEVKWDGVEPNWLPYIEVADVGETIRMAKSLGGELLLQVSDIAILTDPTGAAFGVQHRPTEEK